MSVENLLKKRYELIANYRECVFEIGTIFTEALKGFDGVTKDGYSTIVWNLEKMPHIYKELQWFEKRKEEEMPKFLKHTLSDKLTIYHKVKTYNLSNPKFIEWKWDDADFGNFGMWSKDFNYMPCSEEEYLSNYNKAYYMLAVI